MASAASYRPLSGRGSASASPQVAGLSECQEAPHRPPVELPDQVERGKGDHPVINSAIAMLLSLKRKIVILAVALVLALLGLLRPCRP